MNKERIVFPLGIDKKPRFNLIFKVKGELFYAKLVIKEEYETYSGIVNSGILATILNEVMEAHLAYKNLQTRTFELQIKYWEEISSSVELAIYSKIIKINNELHFVTMESWIENSNREKLIICTAKMLVVDER